MNAREQKALEIADKYRVVQDGHKWTVPSQSGTGKYIVRIVKGNADCTCPDFEMRRSACKHIMAVQYVIERRENPDGTTTVTESVTVTKQVTYPQDWPAYNAAQTNEGDYFQDLLHGLCRGIATPEQEGRGRRTLPLSDAIFAAVYKVYSTQSARRFMSDLRESKERGYMSTVPHFNSIFNYLENERITPLLESLIEVSAQPLAAVETDFAVDSSGFSTSKFERWFDHKYGQEKFRHRWVKVHIMCGVKTNIVTAVAVSDKHDARMLPPLLHTTARGFNVNEVSADKAYLSYENAHQTIRAGATPFIAFKTNSAINHPRAGEIHSEPQIAAWNSMFHYFQYRRDEFLQHYHKRSNVETTFSMIKRKFGDSLRSKSDVAMTNEALCKVLCHNLVVLIHEMFELGIDPVFLSKESIRKC